MFNEKEYQKGYHLKNKIKRNKQSNEYRKMHKVYFKAYLKWYYQTHKEKISLQNKNYRLKNKEVIAKKWRRWYQKNKLIIETKRKIWKLREPYKWKARNYIGKLIQGGFPKAINFKCCNCQIKQAKQYHHFNGYKPYDNLNIVPLCIPCHWKEDHKK